MSVSRIAGRYSQSLIDLAVEQGKLDRVLSDVQTLKQALGNRDLSLMIKSPIIHASNKIAAFDAIFQDKLDELTMSFMRLITKKGREEFLPDIVDSFMDHYRKLKNIIAIKIISAVALSEEQVEQIKNKVGATPGFEGTIEVSKEVNPSIMGGVIIEIGDKKYDASVAHQLDKLKKTFQA